MSREGDLEGERFLVSAGPTAEPLDPVRVFTNRSSGKMGFRLAEAAQARGASVQLVSGPSAEADPEGVDVTRIQTAAEMKRAMLERLAEATVVIMAAAVADYRPEKVERSKIKKGEGPMVVTLVRNDDILAAIGKLRGAAQTVVGFAAESEELEANALGKLERKGLDLIVANDISRTDAGFGVDVNQVILYDARGGKKALPLMSKRDVADEILSAIQEYRAQDRR